MIRLVAGYSILYTALMFVMHFYKEKVGVSDLIVLTAGLISALIYLGLVHYRKVQKKEFLSIILHEIVKLSAVWFLIHSVFRFWDPTMMKNLVWISLIFGTLSSLAYLWFLNSIKSMDKDLYEWDNRLK